MTPSAEALIAELSERLERDCSTDGFTLPNSDAWKAHVGDVRALLSRVERLKSLCTEGSWETVESEQAWKRRAESAEAALRPDQSTKEEPPGLIAELMKDLSESASMLRAFPTGQNQMTGKIHAPGSSILDNCAADLDRAQATITELRGEVERLSKTPWVVEEGFRDTEDLLDMGRVGQSLIEAIANLHKTPGYEHWMPADGPAEIVFDLLNDVVDAKARAESAEATSATLRTALEKAETAAKSANADADMYANAWQRELGQYGIRNKRHHIDAMVLTTRQLMQEAVGVCKAREIIEQWKTDVAAARTLGVAEPDLLAISADISAVLEGKA